MISVTNPSIMVPFSKINQADETDHTHTHTFKCERLLLHLFCCELCSDFQGPESPMVSPESQLTPDRKQTGLMSHGITVSVILII